MDRLDRYPAHLREVEHAVARALEQSADARIPFAGVVFHSGSAAFYHADDLEIPFRSVPHFARFAPLQGPDHLLVVRPGRTSRLARCAPTSYWTEPAEAPLHPCMDLLEVETVTGVDAGAAWLGDVSDCAYVGDSAELAHQLGIAPTAVEPPALMASLDWDRAIKTHYEIDCIREAGRIAGLGHASARAGFDHGVSEREIHADYLAATGHLEHETPYPNIIAWDDRSAILHYQTKRSTRPEPGRSLLIDAGAVCLGYACDITRSYAKPDAHPVFLAALAAMEELQRRLVGAVVPGLGFVELHDRAVRGVCQILCDLGVLLASPEQALADQLVAPFLPHGLGHHLGLQVHDVGGHAADRRGKRTPPPVQHPRLRTTRELAPGQVVTIEPGLYFIETLLETLRQGNPAAAVDWRLVEELLPCGGIRIEDDVLVTSQGREDLTRPWVPGWQVT